ncbi:hypothetical protein LX36DRAFT_659842 [Colletotrichum falcatum]|nr:hypothetical protein LX36DRAFT_659842 [Colletotrichum falcatum]
MTSAVGATTKQSRLLWIKGDPGKGKTMLLCGIVDEPEKLPARTLSFFSCQTTNTHLNSATSVILRGLIYQKSLIGSPLSSDACGTSTVVLEHTSSRDALSKMRSKRHDRETRDAVRQHLTSNANAVPPP